jgi:hypothetical protein
MYHIQHMKPTDWTPYADVNEILTELLTAVPTILNEQFVGMYLDGSLALGDFDEETSDIDFVVVTAAELPEEMMQALVAMHGRIGHMNSKWARDLEGAYIPLAALRRYDPANATHPYIDRGDCQLRWEHLEMDWVIHRHILHHAGLTLAGPPIQTLVDPVLPDELRQAVIGLFNFWWLPMSQEPAQLVEEGNRRYAILTMCRMLYTLAHGAVISKPAAARWALGNLEVRWRPLIEWARVRPTAVPTNNLSETQQFIEATKTLVVTASTGGRLEVGATNQEIL